MKSSTKWFIGLGIVALFVVFYFTGLFQQAGIGGSSLLSLSRVDLQSAFAPLNGAQVWVYTYRLGGLSQYATYTTSPSEAGDLFAGDSLPSDSFKLDVNLDSQSCFYGISADNDLPPVYSLSFVEWNPTIFSSCDWSPSRCNNNEVLVGWTQSFDVSGKCNMICGIKKGVAGRYGSPDVSSIFTVSVSKSGSAVASKSFNTLFSDSKAFDVSGAVGDNVFVNWQGDLSSGRSCPSTSAVLPIYSNGAWGTFSSANYDNYRIVYESKQFIASGFFKDLGSATSDAEVKAYISAVNTASNSALAGRSFGSIDSSNSLSNARAKVSLSSPITYPVLTAYIKASWIGIVTPVGKPKIVSTSSECFSASADGKIKVVVQNVGTEREQFAVSATCTNSIFTVENSNIFLDAGDSGNVFLSVSGDTDKDKITGSCTVNVKGLMFSDSKAVSVCVQGVKLCSVGVLACDGNNVVQCNLAGTGYNILNTCPTGCIYDSSGAPVCKGTPPKPPNPVCGNSICENGESSITCPSDCNQTCAPLLGGLVVGSVGVKSECSFWCQIGLAKPTPVNVCVYDYTGLIIIVIALVIILALIMFGRKKKGKRKSSLPVSSGQDLFRNKNFWRIALIVVLALLLIFYFKFIFWIAVGLLVALILDAIFLGGVIRKIFMR